MEDSCVLFSALDKLGNNAVSTVCFFVVFFQSDLKIFVFFDRWFGEGLWCAFSSCIRAGLFKAGLR